MYPTVETRWFGAGLPPAAVRDWHDAATGELLAAPARVDHYLPLPDSQSLGIKVREGRLEVKQRHGPATRHHFHEGVTGLVATWRKWSFALDPEAMRADPSGLPGLVESWTTVTKQRRLRTYVVLPDGAIISVPPGTKPELGCDWELTEIRIGEGAWWTVGFEAFGAPGSLHRRLLLAVRRLLGPAPPALPLDLSASYPRWLQQLSGE